MPKKILLIGWDAGDWNVAKPLIDAGKMPALKSLMDAGVWGNLATIRPVLSPMLWTSIATGKRAWKHGIHGFSEPCPSTGAIRPITNLSRKTKAVWNIFNQQGWKSNVIGWWPSAPAEPINGVMVSNHFQQAVANLGEDWPMRPGTVHPKRLEAPLKTMRVHPAELGNEHIFPFIPNATEIDETKDKRMESCAKIIAEISGIHAAATACIQLEPWDFTAVYYDGIDHFGHGFMKYHPPQQSWVDEKDFELYQGVIEAGYRYHDMMLQTLLQLAGDDTYVMLISDHGFEPGNLRPERIPNEPAGPAAEHSPYGMFCLKGPGIIQGERIHGASLLDITPTLLHLQGLAVGQDMDGKVLVNCFKEEQSVHYIDSWDEVEGDDGCHPKGAQLDLAESRESLKQLIDLGYIEEPNPDSSKAVDETIRELQYNLAQAYIDGGRFADAATILGKLWERWPETSRFGTKLLSCYISQGNAEAARKQLELLTERKKAAAQKAEVALEAFSKRLNEKKTAAENNEDDPALALSKAEQQRLRSLKAQAGVNQNAFAFFEGSVRILEGRFEEAINVLEQAQNVQTANQPSLYAKLAEAHFHLEAWGPAQQYFEKVLSIQPNNPVGRLGLSRTFLKTKNYFHAAGEALAAIELLFHNPPAHTAYGQALLHLGKPKLAEQTLLTALSQNYGYAPAHRILAKLYEAGALKDPEKAESHNALAKESSEKAKALREQPLTAAASDEVIVEFPHIVEKQQDLGNKNEPLIIVSGLPRSGTSLMMQMLQAAGVELVSDAIRKGDESNPNGYFEDERVKRLASTKDNEWLEAYRGKGIKIVAPLVQCIPQSIPAKIIFMQRPAHEVIRSQRHMLKRDGKPGANSTDASLSKVYTEQLLKFNNWSQRNTSVSVLPIHFRDAVEKPLITARLLASFLDKECDIAAIAAVADAKLYRERKKII